MKIRALHFVGLLIASSMAWPVLLSAQTIPVFLGQSNTLLAPAVDASGRTIVFGSPITSDGTNTGVTDLYAVSSDGSGLRRLTHIPASNTTFQARGANSVSLSADGTRAAYSVIGPTNLNPPPPSGSGDEVHVVDVATGSDRTVAVDTGGCIQPLAVPICAGCSFPCVNTPHISDDGSKIIYSVARNQPFYTVNADGTGLTHLPIFSGSLAPAPQRVISRNGLVVFTSSAPSGPTFAASAWDVYVMNLDGTNIRNVTNFGNDSSIFSSNATISADGSTIAFISTRDPSTGKGTQVNRMWVVHTDGSGLRTLPVGIPAGLSLTITNSQPSLSTDGSLIAFLSRAIYLNGKIEQQVDLSRTDGGGLKVLTDFQVSAAQNPVISADGSAVVFNVGPFNGGNAAIYVVNSDGTDLRALFAPRVLNQGGIVGIDASTPPSPGSLFSVYGMNLTSDTVIAANGFPLPQTLGGISLLVNGRQAPLLAVTPWQVNAQLPSDLTEGPTAFQLQFATGTSPAASAADVKAISPGIFVTLEFTSCGFGCISLSSQAAAFHTNSAVPADTAHPVRAGDVIEIYGTGLGATTPPVPAGLPAPASPPAKTVVTPQVIIGNIQAQVLFSGLTPGLAGVYQVNVVVPGGLRPGQQNVQWKVGSTISTTFATISVQ